MHEDEDELVPVNARHRDWPGRREQMDMYRAAAVAYLKRVRDESGLSLNEIAQRVGVSHTTLTRPVSNVDYKYVPKFATLQRIAQLTGIPLPPDLTQVNPAPPSEPRLRVLSVRGIVAAGMWQAIEDIQDGPLGETRIVEDLSYAGLPQWAELVRGESMNRTYRDGDFLHVVDAPSLGYSPQPDDDVIVERRSSRDGKIERTCKRIVMVNGKFALIGDSTIERWNSPLPLADGEDTTVNIVGMVLGSYRPRRRR